MKETEQEMEERKSREVQNLQIGEMLRNRKTGNCYIILSMFPKIIGVSHCLVEDIDDWEKVSHVSCTGGLHMKIEGRHK